MLYSRKNSNKNPKIQNSPSALGSQSNTKILKHWKKEIELQNTNRYNHLLKPQNSRNFPSEQPKSKEIDLPNGKNGIRFFWQKEREESVREREREKQMPLWKKKKRKTFAFVCVWVRVRDRILEREIESEKPLACSFLVLLIFYVYKTVDKIFNYFFYIHQPVDKFFPNLSIF